MNDLIPVVAVAVSGAVAIGDWRWREYRYRKARESENVLTLESDTAEFFRVTHEQLGKQIESLDGQAQRKHQNSHEVGHLEKGPKRYEGSE